MKLSKCGFANGSYGRPGLPLVGLGWAAWPDPESPWTEERRKMMGMTMEQCIVTGKPVARTGY
jgi:hypothetical protein